MRNRLPKALFGLAAAMLCPFPVQAQLPDYRQCLPFPTYEEEIRDMLGVAPVASVEKRPRQIVFVEKVKLRGAKTLPPALRAQIIASLLHREFEADSDWLPQVQEINIRGLLQEHGYFNTWVADGIVRPLGSKAGRSRVAVTVEVDEGLQYRLAEIRFVSQDPEQTVAFSQQELRKLIPIDDGEILNTRKIIRGLESLRHLYGANGYIDFVSEPNFDVDDTRKMLTLTIALVSGLQYRIGSVEFPYLDAETVKRLKWVPVRGEVFDNSAYERFFEDNKAVIACARPEQGEISRDIRRGTVRLTFLIHSCYDLWARLFRCLQMRLIAVGDLACRK